MASSDSTIQALDGSGGKTKLVALVVIVLAALAGAAWFLLGLGGSRGAKDRPTAVLIVGPETDDLAGWINKKGFAAEQISHNAAVTSGQEFAPDAEELDAIITYADEKGFGYVALHPPELYNFAALTDGDTAEAPEGTTMAVVNVGDIAESPRVTFGIPSRSVKHTPPADKRVGLYLALFEQSILARVVKDDFAVDDLDVMQALTDGDAVAYYNGLQEAQKSFDAVADSWTVAAMIESPPRPTAALGGPFEGVDAYPLANGGIVAIAGARHWYSDDGLYKHVEEDDGRIARYIPPQDVAKTKSGEAVTGEPCGPLDTDGIRAARVNEAGNALALQRFIPTSNVDGTPSSSGRWVVQFVKLADLPACPFATTGYPLQSRQMYDLGPVDPSGAMLMAADRLRFGLKGGERSWNYPVVGPDGGAAAWVDSTLAVYSGSSSYDESHVVGLAFMTSLTENRLEAFFPAATLLPNHDPNTVQISHVTVLDKGRFVLVVDDRESLKKSLIEVQFSRPVRSFLVPVDHTGNMPKQLKKLTYTARSGFKTTVIAKALPEFETASLDAKVQRLAFIKDGNAFSIDLRKPDAEPVELTADGKASHIRIAPNGSYAIYHRQVEASGEAIPTANIVWIE